MPRPHSLLFKTAYAPRESRISPKVSFIRMGVMLAALVVSIMPVRSATASSTPIQVVADIPPLHSLVSMVMDGVTEPALLLDTPDSVHHASLRPSAARRLAEAEVVFFTDSQLTPWLAKPLRTLAQKAQQVEMARVQGSTTLAFRYGEPGHQHHGHHDDDHDKHHDDEHHAKKKSESHDPHLWLSAANARTWLGAIAGVLAKTDPENADRYFTNAAAAILKLTEQQQDWQNKIDSQSFPPFLVGHDAFQYLERDFGLEPIGAVILGDDAPPSPAQLATLRDKLAPYARLCVFVEPGFNSGLLEAVMPTTRIIVISLDPVGRAIPPGALHYQQLMDSLLDGYQRCVKEAGAAE